jgi:hypothetical protein
VNASTTSAKFPFQDEMTALTLIMTHGICFLLGTWSPGFSWRPSGNPLTGVFGHGFAPIYHSTPGEHTVTLDIGAASNLTGADSMRDFERDCLIPRGQYLDGWKEHGSFTGIAGKEIVTDDVVCAPFALGQGLPLMEYTAHALRSMPSFPEVNLLPTLVSLQSMKELSWRLFLDQDAAYVPDPHFEDETLYRKIGLIYTGHHYRMHVDRFDEGPESGPHPLFRILIQEVDPNNPKKTKVVAHTKPPKVGPPDAPATEEATVEPDDEYGSDDETPMGRAKYRNLFRETSIGVLRKNLRTLQGA